MRDMQAPWLVRSVGSHWLPSLTVLVLILFLVAVLLDRLEEVAGESEQLLVKLTERNMRTGLQLAVLEAMAHGRAASLVDWVGQDPSVWLGQPPVGYGGACQPDAKALVPGGWCFDSGARVLWYRRRHAAQGIGWGGARLSGWKVVATRLSEDGRRVEGLNVESVTQPLGK